MKIIFTFILIFIFNGCSYNVQVSSLTDEEREKLSSIELLENEPQQKYEIIREVVGISCINLGSTKDDPNIKEEAYDGIKTASAKVHADAAILEGCKYTDTIDFGKNCFSTLNCYAKAINYAEQPQRYSPPSKIAIDGVEIYFGSVPRDIEYEEIEEVEGVSCFIGGLFRFESTHNVEDVEALNDMRDKAFKLGGDAVANVFCQTNSTVSMRNPFCKSTVGCYGIIIKYNDIEN